MPSDTRQRFRLQNSSSNGVSPLRNPLTSRGYTLIEVLIAMAIFSSMVMLATMALNQGLKEYHGLMERGVNFWDNAKRMWINRSFNSVLDYYVNSEGGKWFPYFYGNQERVSYVSLSPLAGDFPVIVWIINERQENGRRSLVYYENPVLTKNLKDIERDYIFKNYKKGHSIRLLEDVENLEVRFFGYDFLTMQNQWSDDFDGSKRMTLPSLVKISYTQGGKRNMMVFGINTNSRRKMAYNEAYPGQ